MSNAHEPGVGAVDTALKLIRHRDLSAAELDRRLAQRGFSELERGDAFDALSRTGLLDDSRFAQGRAASLAGRGAGDALVRAELEHAGVEVDLVEEALQSLEPEAERARRVLERRGSGARTYRYLRSKGFSEETIVGLVANGSHERLR